MMNWVCQTCKDAGKKWWKESGENAMIFLSLDEYDAHTIEKHGFSIRNQMDDELAQFIDDDIVEDFRVDDIE